MKKPIKRTAKKTTKTKQMKDGKASWKVTDVKYSLPPTHTPTAEALSKAVSEGWTGISVSGTRAVHMRSIDGGALIDMLFVRQEAAMQTTQVRISREAAKALAQLLACHGCEVDTSKPMALSMHFELPAGR